MDIRTIKKLIELIENTGVGEIEIQEGDKSIRVSRYAAQSPTTASPSITHHFANPPSPQSVPTETVKKEGDEPKKHSVNSPMVGTVYLGPNPNAPRYVEIGQHVEMGHVLCIIEAMKMFNEILADKAGIVTARLIDNEQPVEFDQPLFVIE